VQGDDKWEESDDAWTIGEEEEAMIVGTIQQEDNSSWQEASDSWMELDGEGESGDYCVGTCQGASSEPPEAMGKYSDEASCPLEEEEDEELIGNGWWSPDPGELQIGEGEQEYFIELLMGGSASGGGESAPGRPPAASSATAQPAKKEVALEPEARNPKKARESKPNMSKGKGKSSEGAPRGKSEPDIKTGGKETGTWNGEESEGWQPSCQGQEGPPDHPADCRLGV
jgi:hypothetical protein